MSRSAALTKGGARLPTREFRGAARLATKSVEEMAKDRAASTRLAAASEKAGKERRRWT